MSRFFRSASERHSLIRESGASATMLNGHSGAEALAGAAVQLPEAGSKKPEKPFVAIQIGARSFVDEGVDKCLDTLVSSTI